MCHFQNSVYYFPNSYTLKKSRNFLTESAQWDESVKLIKIWKKKSKQLVLIVLKVAYVNELTIDIPSLLMWASVLLYFIVWSEDLALSGKVIGDTTEKETN